MLNVLIACEESQRVCIEMRKLGHRAYSCDILPCSGGHPEWHIQGDVLPLLNGDCTFQTADYAAQYEQLHAELSAMTDERDKYKRWWLDASTENTALKTAIIKWFSREFNK